jgi:RNA binding exosome subunit
MKGQIRSVEVSYIVHATEDEERIENAVKKILDIEENPRVDVLEGHFGNRILRVIFHLTGESAYKTFRKIFDSMPEILKKYITDRINIYLDEHRSLYLRFDKQSIIQGRIELSESDSVRIKIKPRLYLVKGTEGDFYRRLIYLEKR